MSEIKEKIIGLKLTKDNGGHLLHFKDSKGRHAVLNIEEKFPDKLRILDCCIRQWAEDQFQR